MTPPPGITTPANPTCGVRLRRLAAIVLVFIAVGPLVGLMVFLLSTTLTPGMNFWGLVVVSWVAMPYAVPLIAWFGVVTAAAGLLVGIRLAFYGAITWPFAVAGGIALGFGSLLPGLGYRLWSGQPILPPSGVDVMMLVAYAGTVATYLSVTLVCWAIVRNWYFEPARADKVQA
jgi:hypothetical protein